MPSHDFCSSWHSLHGLQGQHCIGQVFEQTCHQVGLHLVASQSHVKAGSQHGRTPCHHRWPQPWSQSHSCSQAQDHSHHHTPLVSPPSWIAPNFLAVNACHSSHAVCMICHWQGYATQLSHRHALRRWGATNQKTSRFRKLWWDLSKTAIEKRTAGCCSSHVVMYVST